MTAALTRIVYSEKKNYAKIHFYTKDGWAGIKRLAEEFDEKLDHLVAEKLREKQKALQGCKNSRTCKVVVPKAMLLK